MILAIVATKYKSEVLKIQEESHIVSFLSISNLNSSMFVQHLWTEVSPDLKNHVFRWDSQKKLDFKPNICCSNIRRSCIFLHWKGLRGARSSVFYGKGYGFVAWNCRNKSFCSYCKCNGHIISECTRQPQWKSDQRQQKAHPNQAALQAQVHWWRFFLHWHGRYTRTDSRHDSELCPKFSYCIYNFAFSAMGMSGRSFHTAFSSLPMSHSLSWFIDSGASNHMTSIDQHFDKIKPYAGHEQITAVNGQHLSMTDIVSIGLTTSQNHSPALSSVFFVLKLSANLLSVGQSVDHVYLVTIFLMVVLCKNNRLGGW